MTRNVTNALVSPWDNGKRSSTTADVLIAAFLAGLAAGVNKALMLNLGLDEPAFSTDNKTVQKTTGKTVKDLLVSFGADFVVKVTAFSHMAQRNESRLAICPIAAKAR